MAWKPESYFQKALVLGYLCGLGGRKRMSKKQFMGKSAEQWKERFLHVL